MLISEVTDNPKRDVMKYAYSVLDRLKEHGEKVLSTPSLKTKYTNWYDFENGVDVDSIFADIVDTLKEPFDKLFALDDIIREYTGQEGLNDYVWLLEPDSRPDFSVLKEAMLEFYKDLGAEPTFAREIKTILGN